jgi:hypothetical protein
MEYAVFPAALSAQTPRHSPPAKSPAYAPEENRSFLSEWAARKYGNAPLDVAAPGPGHVNAVFGQQTAFGKFFCKIGNLPSATGDLQPACMVERQPVQSASAPDMTRSRPTGWKYMCSRTYDNWLYRKQFNALKALDEAIGAGDTPPACHAATI